MVSKEQNMTKSTSVTIRMDQAAEQTRGFVKRVYGLVKLKGLIPLITDLDLEANPRDSKVSKVTNDILESLEKTPETFPYKTKGILVAASSYNVRDRNRYELTFENPQIEGILDGGHNTLAIGLHILELALGEDFSDVQKSVKLWDDFKKAWDENADKLKEFREENEGAQELLSTYVPVELLLPSDPENEIGVEAFNKALLEICAARNNNAQLKIEAKANAQGYFETLKQVLPAHISERVEWRPNDGGEVKTPDLVALSWIPLSFYSKEFTDEDGREVEAPSMTQIYSSKGECVSRFERLMSSPEVSESGGGSFKRDLKSLKVFSALKIAGDLPELFDLIYELFPDLYNSHEGKFGRILAVKKMNSAKVKKTKFTQKAIEWRYPEGYIVPLVAGLRALMEKGEDGQLRWKVSDPVEFVKKHLPSVVLTYKGVIELVDYDPQKVGKAAAAYENASAAFETAFYRSQAR
jgi:hypothetical protein